MLFMSHHSASPKLKFLRGYLSEIISQAKLKFGIEVEKV